MSTYPNDPRTPAERERDAAQVNAAVANDIAANESVNRQIAENVAVGESIRADRAQQRASTYAAMSAEESARANDFRRQRDYAQMDSAIARNEAQGNAFAFWMLLGTLLVLFCIGAVWYLNRPEPVATTTTVIHRDVATTPSNNSTSTAASASKPAQTPVQPVVVPVPVPGPPRVIERPVPVAVPVPVQTAAPAPAPRATSIPDPGDDGDFKKPATTNNPDEPLHGYVAPSDSGQ